MRVLHSLTAPSESEIGIVQIDLRAVSVNSKTYWIIFNFDTDMVCGNIMNSNIDVEEAETKL